MLFAEPVTLSGERNLLIIVSSCFSVGQKSMVGRCCPIKLIKSISKAWNAVFYG